MGILLAKLWSLFSNEEHKVVIVGLDNAGKTTILYQFLMDEVVHTSPTIGSNVEEVVWKNVHFIMWDLGGQDSLRAAWNTYYSNTEFLIVVIDSTDRERLSITKEELWKMLSHELVQYSPLPAKTPPLFAVIMSGSRAVDSIGIFDLTKAAVLIYANKQDIKGCMSPAEISEQLNLTSIKKHRWQIQACCALSGEGLYQGLEWIYNSLKSKK